MEWYHGTYNQYIETAVVATHMRDQENPALLSVKYWLFNKDAYNGLLESTHNWVGVHPLYTRNNPVFVDCSYKFLTLFSYESSWREPFSPIFHLGGLVGGFNPFEKY